MKPCKGIRAQARALAARPAAGWPAEVAAHVGRCEQCERAVAGARLARGLVGAAASEVEPGPGFADRVLAALQARPARPADDLWRPAWALLPTFATVAAALLAFFLQAGAPAGPEWPGPGAGLSASERLVLGGAAADRDLVLEAVLEDGGR